MIVDKPYIASNQFKLIVTFQNFDWRSKHIGFYYLNFEGNEISAKHYCLHSATILKWLAFHTHYTDSLKTPPNTIYIYGVQFTVHQPVKRE